jgi:hypothetical protein
MLGVEVEDHQGATPWLLRLDAKQVLNITV